MNCLLPIAYCRLPIPRRRPLRASTGNRQSAIGNRHSFTLIETLATLLLAAIVLPLAMQGLTLSLHAASTARHQAEAAQLAEMKLNELLTVRDITRLNSYGDFGDAWPQYQWQSAARHWGDALYEVTVTVQWQERNRERALSLATLVYTSGLEPEAEVEP